MKQDEHELEIELIARSMDGDEKAYAILVDRYKEGVYRHCFKFTHDENDAEDIALDAFVEAYTLIVTMPGFVSARGYIKLRPILR